MDKLCVYIINASGTDNAAKKTADNLSAMISPENPDSPILFAHLAYLCGFHQHFFDQQFEWLQDPDDIAKEPSFISRHILGRYFLAAFNLTELNDPAVLREKPHFAHYKQAREKVLEIAKDEENELSGLYTEHMSNMDKIEKGFIEKSQETMHKHFTRWATHLLFLSLAAETPIGRVVATYMLQRVDETDIETPYMQDPDFDSPMHGRTIPLKAFYECLQPQEATCNEEDIKAQIAFVGQLVLE